MLLVDRESAASNDNGITRLLHATSAMSQLTEVHRSDNERHEQARKQSQVDDDNGSVDSDAALRQNVSKRTLCELVCSLRCCVCVTNTDATDGD